jgi:hypothetical protein
MPPPHNFFLADLTAVAAAFFLCSLFVFAPGYVFGWITNAFGFRRLDLPWKAAVGISLSIALCPVLTYLVGRFSSMTVVWWMYGAIWLAFVGLLLSSPRPAVRSLLNRRGLLFLGIVLAWIVVGVLSLVDLQIGDRLYFSVVSFDYSLRTAFTGAISRTGLPPANPLFYPGHPVPLRYHYFWLILCSLTDQVGGQAVDPRQAIIGSTLWCGLGLLAIAFLYLRFFSTRDPANLRRRMLIAAGLFTVTGLDLIPTLLLLTRRLLSPEMEWWNEQITTWVGSVLWVPHHVAGLIAGLTGFLILWNVPPVARTRDKLLPVLAAALAFATMVGSSIYVAFVCALFLGAWTVVTFLKKWYPETVLLAAAGALTVLLSMPYLTEVQTSASGGQFVRLAVRPFSFLFSSEPSWQTTLANAATLPLNYLLEFGFFFLVAVVQLRRYRRSGWRLSREELCGTVMLASSILVCTFLRSGVISNNDLGMRGALLAQFILLIWSVDVIEQGWPGSGSFLKVSRSERRLMILFLAIGVAGSLWEVVLLRTFPLLSDAGKVDKYAWLSSDDKLGKRTYALRQVYEDLRNTLPAAGIVQHNPDTVPNDLFFGLYAGRQAAADTMTCGTVFGGDAASCPPIVSRLQGLFSGRAPDPDMVCRDLSIDVLVVKDTDAVWRLRDSWVWTRKPLIATNLARAFHCGK